MTRQHVSRTNQQTQRDTPLVSGMLQCAAVQTVPENEVEPTQEVEATTLRKSQFQHDFSQVPVSTSEMPRIQPKLKIGGVGDRNEQQAERVARQVVDKRNSLAQETVGDRIIQGKGKMIENSQEPSEVHSLNQTGIPDRLKAGIEDLSGYSMDDVRVHYNSAKPAQLYAHAYTQGKDIHVASGQEKHLPHEVWHVVQQKQGRVKQTMQMKGGVFINDDVRLEKEADIMGNKTFQFVDNSQEGVTQRKPELISKKNGQSHGDQGICTSPIQTKESKGSKVLVTTTEKTNKVSQLFKIKGMGGKTSPPPEVIPMTPEELEMAYLRTMYLSEIGEHALNQLPGKTLKLVQVYGNEQTLFTSATDTVEINIDRLSTKSPEEQCAVLCHETFHFFNKMHINLNDTDEAANERREKFKVRTQTDSERFGTIEEELAITGKIAAIQHQSFMHEGLDHGLFNENAVLRGFELAERTSHGGNHEEHKQREFVDPEELNQLSNVEPETKEQERKRTARFARMLQNKNNKRKNK